MAGTSEGAKAAWDTRGRGRHTQASEAAQGAMAQLVSPNVHATLSVGGVERSLAQSSVNFADANWHMAATGRYDEIIKGVDFMHLPASAKMESFDVDNAIAAGNKSAIEYKAQKEAAAAARSPEDKAIVELNNYVQNYNVNDYLQHGKGSYDADAEHEFKRQTKGMDKALEVLPKFKSSEPLVRVIAAKEDLNLQPGGMLEHNRFFSTRKMDRVADLDETLKTELAPGNEWGNKVGYKITVTSHKSGVDLGSSFVKERQAKLGADLTEQGSEVLFPRKAKFKIDSVQKVGDVVHVKVHEE